MALTFNLKLLHFVTNGDFAGKRRRQKRKGLRNSDVLSISSGSSKYSSNAISMLVDSLKSQQNRASTNKTYLAVWRKFNAFLLNLDKMPGNPHQWEYRTVLFVGYLIESGIQSSTIKSYVSAIKRTLLNDNYDWKDQVVQLNSLTRACKLKNDVLYTHLPIHCSLLEHILFEIK